MTDPDPRQRTPFGPHDYELTYGWRDEALNVTIGGKLATPPAIGDVYTLGSPAGIQDFTVVHLSREGGRGWLARCTATPYVGHGSKP